MTLLQLFVYDCSYTGHKLVAQDDCKTTAYTHNNYSNFHITTLSTAPSVHPDTDCHLKTENGVTFFDFGHSDCDITFELTDRGRKYSFAVQYVQTDETIKIPVEYSKDFSCTIPTGIGLVTGLGEGSERQGF